MCLVLAPPGAGHSGPQAQSHLRASERGRNEAGVVQTLLLAAPQSMGMGDVGQLCCKWWSAAQPGAWWLSFL